MWFQDATKQDLLTLIQSDCLSNQPLRQLQSIRELPESSSELQLLWREDPRELGKLPSVIIVEKKLQRDFFAWTGTYLPYCRPLTALCRVTCRDTLQSAVSTDSFGLGQLETICIGLIIGEAATYVVGHPNFNRLSIPAFTGTYSFVVARAIAANMLPAERDKIGELWAKARQITGQKFTNLSLADLNQVWRLVFNISRHKSLEKWRTDNEPGILELACRQVSQAGEISENIWQSLTRGLIDNDINIDLLKGPREGRVLQVERLLASLSQRTIADKMTLGFIGGYLASRIAPGTFDHQELLQPYLTKLPTLLLWYGLCAGLPSDSKLRNFGTGIGRRIIREAVHEEVILNRPRCDIALEELEVLASGKDPAQNLQLKESGHLIVDILPYVNCTMRNPDGRQFESGGSSLIQQTIYSNYGVSEIRGLLADLDLSLNSVGRIRDQIVAIIDNGEQRKGRGKRGKS